MAGGMPPPRRGRGRRTKMCCNRGGDETQLEVSAWSQCLSTLPWIEDRIQAELAMGLHADLVNEELQGLVREHSFRERLWGQLMLALYGCGRQTEALAAFQEVRHPG